MRDALALSAAFRAKAFALLRRASYFLFAWPKRKVTKEKSHPTWRLPGLLPGKSVSRGRAFRTGILPVRKGIDILVDAHCAACRPRLTAAQGPRVEQRAILARTRWKAEKLGSNSNSAHKSGGEAQLCCCSAVAPASLRSARWMRAALLGPPLKRRAGEGKPAGWFAGMRTSLASVHGWTVDKPRSPHADFPGMDVRKARKRGGLLFGYLSLTPGILPCALRASFAVRSRSKRERGHARESNSPSVGGRKLFTLQLLALKKQQARASRLKSLLQDHQPC